MDKQEKRTFREQLLSQEKSDTQLREKFQLETRKMYTENLKTSQRFAHVLVSLIIVFFTLFFWAMAKVFENLQIQHDISYFEPLRLASMWAMYLSMAMIVLCLWPAIRGKIGLRFYPKIVRFIFWVLIFAIVTLYFGVFDMIDKQIVPNISNQITWVFTMMILVIVMGVYMLLSGRIDRGDMKNKAKTLELEYRIAKLEEKLNRQADGAKV